MAQNTVQMNPNIAQSTANIAQWMQSQPDWQTWNTAMTSAWQQGNAEANEALLHNVRETARLFIASGRPLDSQSLEARRTLALYKQTLNTHDEIQGFIQVLEHYWQGFTQPSDMNLAHAQARGDPMQALQQLPQLITNSLHSAQHWLQLAREQPELVVSVALTVPDMLNAAARKQMIDIITSPNPGIENGKRLAELAIGIVAGLGLPGNQAVKAAQLTENISDAAMDWQRYQKLLGEGSTPKTPPHLRDFSEKVEIHKDGDSLAEYYYKSDHKSAFHNLALDLNNGTASFSVVSEESLRATYGSGLEMFMSVLERIRQEKQTVDCIHARWPYCYRADFSVNHAKFWANIDAGMSIEQAAKKTWTGQAATNAGFNELQISDSMRKKIEEGERTENLAIEFVRQKNFSATPDSTFDNYGNAWVSSMGRPGMEVHSRDDVPHHPLPEPYAVER